MKIKLNEIPEDGRHYTINRTTGELNQDLQDLIADHPYDFEFSITPLNKSDYELRGTVNTTTDELCSLCGDTFKFKVQAKIHEILIEAAPEEKGLEKQSRSNHFSELNESGPSVIEYKDDVFEFGQFGHEVIALNIPFNPKPEQTANGDCKVCLKTNMTQPFKYDEDMGVFEKAKEKENPFNVLKGLKIN
jgi:uncharacterized protein